MENSKEKRKAILYQTSGQKNQTFATKDGQDYIIDKNGTIRKPPKISKRNLKRKLNAVGKTLNQNTITGSINFETLE